MAMANVKTSTPKIQRGFRRGHEVTAAGGGRVVVGNQCAKEERKVLWLDPDTGEWREFKELIPGFDPHYFRIPRADLIFEKGLWYGQRRWPVRTYKGWDWSECQSENIQVIISVLPTDKPLGAAVAAPKPNPPLPIATTAKERARMDPPEWLEAAIACFPERKGESREEYFERLAKKMRQELKNRAVWEAVSLGRKAYEFGLLPRRQVRAEKTKNSH